MPAVKFSARLDLEQIILFVDGHELTIFDCHIVDPVSALTSFGSWAYYPAVFSAQKGEYRQ
jgi:hypothetical protein